MDTDHYSLAYVLSCVCFYEISYRRSHQLIYIKRHQPSCAVWGKIKFNINYIDKINVLSELKCK